MLYKRDYLLGLTDEEKKEFKEVTGRDFSVKRIGGFGTANNFMSFPKAARMCKMLFPNNYLDVAELHDTERLIVGRRIEEDANCKLFFPPLSH